MSSDAESTQAGSEGRCEIPTWDPTLNAARAKPQLLPTHLFVRRSDAAFYRLASDGSHLSYMAPWGEARRLNIFIKPVFADGRLGEERRLTSEVSRDIAACRWKGPRTLVFSKDAAGDENFHVFSVDAETGVLIDLTPGNRVKAEVLDALPMHPTDVLISHNGRDARVFDVYRVNVFNAQATLVAMNPGRITKWVTDNEGRVRAAVETDGANRKILYRASENDSFSALVQTNFREWVDPQCFDPSDKALFVISNRGRDKAALALLNPEDGSERVIWAHPNVDIDSISYSTRSRTLQCANFRTWRAERYIFDEAYARAMERLGQLLPGYELSVQSTTADEKTWIVSATNDRTRGSRYLFNTESESLALLNVVAPWLPEEQMAPMNPIEFRARDGQAIQGYVTLPLGQVPENLPVVVMPHGGPWLRDSWGFDYEVQFLANRGFAVLQVNFRGSTGFGRSFWEAGFKQWGGAIQDDISDGVLWLIDKGVADPGRIGIYGTSFGGYAALMAIAKTPDLFAAAVASSAVTNVSTLADSIPPYWEPMRQMLYEMVGDPATDLDELEAASPINIVEKLGKPLLVRHGANDPRASKEDCDAFVQALRNAGSPVEYFVEQEEGHGLSNEENQIKALQQTERFFTTHLGPTY